MFRNQQASNACFHAQNNLEATLSRAKADSGHPRTSLSSGPDLGRQEAGELQGSIARLCCHVIAVAKCCPH